MQTIFKVDTIANAGKNWLIAELGEDDDGEKYILTTQGVHASELYYYSQGAKADGELIARLLNEHFDRLATKEG